MSNCTAWVVAGLVVLSACQGTDGESSDKRRLQGATSETASATQASARVCDGEPDDLVDPDLPRAQAGDRGYGYHLVAEDDLDGDGVKETAHVIAQLTKDPDGKYSGDFEPRYHIYVDEPSGERTYVFSGFVWGGRLEVDVSPGDRHVFVIQYEGASAFEVYCAEYLGPGKVMSMKIASFGRSPALFRQAE